MRRITTLRGLVLFSLPLMLLAPTLHALPEGVTHEADQQKPKPLVVFLARHAEKEVNASSDPELSASGHDRSDLLATMLRDVELDAIHSSNFIRTRDTAAPVASTHQLEVELYDPRDLPAFVQRLVHAGGTHLVVGHSNTTPKVVELLGGEPGTEIDEAAEYDRLYIVTKASDSESSTLLIRYGPPFSRE